MRETFYDLGGMILMFMKKESPNSAMKHSVLLGLSISTFPHLHIFTFASNRDRSEASTPVSHVVSASPLQNHCSRCLYIFRQIP